MLYKFRWKWILVLLSIAPLFLEASVKVYVTSADTYVSVLDADSNTFVKNFTPSIGGTTAAELQGVAISPDQTKAYIVDSSNNGIWIINTIDDSTSAFVSLSSASAPFQINVTPDGSKVYIADVSAGVVFVMTTADNAITTITGGAIKPSGLAFNPSGTKLYVSDVAFFGSSVHVYNTSDDSSVTTIAAGIANFLAISSLGTGYAPLSDLTIVSVFDTATDIATGTITTTGNDLEGVAFTTDGVTAYVASAADQSMQVIVNGVLDSEISLLHRLWQVAINPENQSQVYSTTNPQSTVVVVNNGVRTAISDFDNNLTSAAYLAYIVSANPSPPTSLTGSVIKNRFVLQTDTVHRLAWPASASSDVVSYAVLRNGSQIATVSSTSYDDHNRSPNTTDFYQVKAIDADGNQSYPVSVYIP